jgi:uncharacterized membrane protein YdcZ (DUF606 family)
MTTLRDIGEVAIKVIGLYYAGRVLSLYVALMLTPYLLSPQAFSASDPLLAASISSAVGSLVLAIVALSSSRRVAGWTFPAKALSSGGSTKEWLFVGIAVLGAWIAADATVGILRSAAAFVYYSQTGLPLASLERSTPQVVANVVTVVVGVVLMSRARRVAQRLDRN